MRRSVLAAFALTVLAACQPDTTVLNEEQKAAIADTVSGIHSGLADAVRAADVVLVTAQGTVSATDTSGVTEPEVPIAMTYIWTRTDIGWKVSYAHVSVGHPEVQ